MLIVDQLNLTGRSPLVGKLPFPGVKDRFVDMVDAYDPHLCDLARHIAGSIRSRCTTDLCRAHGTAYESPAEAKLWRSMGADAVGMSTVLETIAARALGLSVVGFSLITNVHFTAMRRRMPPLSLHYSAAHPISRASSKTYRQPRRPATATPNHARYRL